MIDQLFKAMEGRSTGREAKRAAHVLQFLSAGLFAALSLTTSDGWLRVLFCSEALGQLLLAVEGLRTLQRGDVVVRYFAREPLGVAAALVFVITAMSRYALALEVAGSALWLVVPAAAFMALHVVAVAFRHVRTDIAIGTALSASALLLGVALLAHGALSAAASQFAYAALLALGALALRPWVAECLNLGVFASALAIDMQGGIG
jgi:hypothetical protein